MSEVVGMQWPVTYPSLKSPVSSPQSYFTAFARSIVCSYNSTYFFALLVHDQSCFMPVAINCFQTSGRRYVSHAKRRQSLKAIEL